MAISNLPRGIQLLQWVNQSDNSIQNRYRVRIIRKDLKADRVFDDLEEAKEFLNLSKVTKGKEIIFNISEEERKKKEDEKLRNFYAETLGNPPLEIYINKFISTYVDTREQETYLQKRNTYNIKCFYRLICNAEIEHKTSDQHFNPVSMMHMIQGSAKKRFGSIPLSEIDFTTINAFIRAELTTGKKKSSVARAVSLLSKFFTKLKHINPALRDFPNPCVQYDKELLANANGKREYRLSDEEELKLMEALNKRKSPEMKNIVLLSLYTAMRRSEILTLTWNQIRENYIQLTHTKSGRPRKVWLTTEAKEILKSIPKKPNTDKIFTYSITGFEGSFTKMKEAIGLKHMRFHDLRRESISRLVERVGTKNSILLTEILGMASVRKFHENYLQDIPMPPSTEEAISKLAGHSNLEETKGYFNIKE